FCGPPGTGNGGYVAGRLARLLGSAGAEVTLRRPVPLDRALRVEREGEARLRLCDGDAVVAEAAPAEPDPAVPAAPSFAEAEEAARGYLGFVKHGVSNCFVCGPARAPGSGLRIFAGPLGADGHVAAPWVPGSADADASGRVPPELVWAALDCPGAFA